MGLFSSKAKSNANVRRNTAKVSEQDLAILELKNTRDKLVKYQSRLDIEMQQLHESAKKLVLAKKKVLSTCFQRCYFRSTHTL